MGDSKKNGRPNDCYGEVGHDKKHRQPHELYDAKYGVHEDQAAGLDQGKSDTRHHMAAPMTVKKK